MSRQAVAALHENFSIAMWNVERSFIFRGLANHASSLKTGLRNSTLDFNLGILAQWDGENTCQATDKNEKCFDSGTDVELTGEDKKGKFRVLLLPSNCCPD